MPAVKNSDTSVGDEAMKQRLLQAAERFAVTKADLHLFLEVDAVRCFLPEEMVGKQLRVYWPDDDVWYLGEVMSYNPANAEHLIQYVDGDREAVVAGLERIQLQVPVGCPLPEVSPQALRTYADALLNRARAIGLNPSNKQLTPLHARAAELTDVANRTVEKEAASTPAPVNEDRETKEVALYHPGDIVWGKVNGYPDWPALVITRELPNISEGCTMEMRKAGIPRQGLPLCYFGTFERQRIKHSAVTPFIQGAEADYHAKRTIKKKYFVSALCEVATFMQDGELPERMLPCGDDNIDDDDDDRSHKPAGKRRKMNKNELTVDGVPVMPMHVSKNFTVTALGRVEWIHPQFHNEKFIWPIGYTSERITMTPAGGKNAAKHVCEVLVAEDGSGPIFRVTVGKGKHTKAYDGSTPGKAWAQLHHATPSGPGGGPLNGNAMFGFSNATVTAAIQSLPGAVRCERYVGWPDGCFPPAPPPLSKSAQRKRLVAEARLWRLPPEIHAVPAVDPTPGVCCVCFEEEDDDDDLIVQCDGCKLYVHTVCYGLREPPHGRLWLCDGCTISIGAPSLKSASPFPTCVLCPVSGGGMKRTTCGRWCHTSCALWFPETLLQRESEHCGLVGLIDGIADVHPSRRRIKCKVCKQLYGACLQCCEPGCYTSFHITCAKQAGYASVVAADSDDEDVDGEEAAAGGHETRCGTMKVIREEEEEEEETGRCHQNQNYHRVATVTSQVPGCGATHSNEFETGVPAKNSKKKKGKNKRVSKEGTRINGVRLLVYCDKHTAPGHTKRTPLRQAPNTVAGDATKKGGRPRKHHVHSQDASEKMCVEDGVRLTECTVATDSQSLPGSAPTTKDGLDYGASLQINRSRSAPLDSAGFRRGHREPDSMSAALAKRCYVQATPLILGGPLNPSHRHIPSYSFACTKKEKDVVGVVGDDGQPAPKGDAAACVDRDSMIDVVAPPPARFNGTSRGCGKLVAVVDRYHAMRASEGRRIVPGKSAIHGWGAFARELHSKDDMVIEYVGELVRPSVADVRERTLYNSMVGAGTYIFQLNWNDCVDATRSGNLAHLLNHSCEPNCYSRTIKVLEPKSGKAIDHVVIFALKDISVGEELTYDYRFSGNEQLVCNCGAGRCRGMVNKAPPEKGKLVPRREVKPYIAGGQ